MNDTLKFPYDFHELDPKLNEELKKYFRGNRAGFVQVGPERYLFPREYKDAASKIYNFKVRPSDVWIVTYPRSGTTWTQEMLWMIANDLDFDKALSTPLAKRFPFLEFHTFVNGQVMEELKEPFRGCPDKLAQIDQLAQSVLKPLELQTERRFIKTHLPFSLLPPDLLTKGCKVVYVARNPLDAAVSYYHLYKSMAMMDYIGSFERFWDYFKRDLIGWNPYWSHIKEAWQRRHEKDLLFLFYEKMNEDLRGAIQEAAKFLGKSLTPEGLEKLEEHLRIENFRKNKAINNDSLKDLKIIHENGEDFVRRGKSGGWRDYFTEEGATEAKKWVVEKEEEIGITFKL